MNNLLTSDFPLPSNAYLAFDGLTIKEKIKERLTQTGVFTDQNFEGSNLSALNDVIAMVFSLLIYNLNRTANEGQFSNAQIYENINRIVKQLDYKPIGHQTATLAFSMSAQNLNAGLYTIPRFTSINSDGVNYTFSQDITFSKTSNNTLEAIPNVGNNEVLYQGTFIEFPTYTAAGNNNELVYLTVNDTSIVDNFNIDVYIKTSDKWVKWSKTQSLYMNTANDTVYELRFNENKRYELKFGNNINGKALKENDLVAIYYLKSDGPSGELAANSLLGNRATVFNSARFNQILNDTVVSSTNYLNNINGIQYLIFNNNCVSSNYASPESVDDIKRNAPGLFRSQYSLTTQKSYETYIKTNFSNIIQDVKVKNNSEFLDSYVKYFYDLGLTRPQLESRALFNQMRMGDSCNFNNVYAFVVPKTVVTNNLGYLYPSQKSVILDSIQNQKTLTSEVIISDPVYLVLDIALSDSNTTLLSDIGSTKLYIEPSPASKRNSTSIIHDVNYVINNYFNRTNIKLGQTIDINQLTNDILGIDGVKRIFTKRTDSGYMVEGIRMLIWNPVYGDISSSVVVGNTTVADFQFPYLFNTDFTNRIEINDTFSKYDRMAI